MSDSRPLVTVLINNYNYGRFLGEAIDSALNQTYPNIEVIVVDDGSLDDSREIIASYGNQLRSILKENGGQASAFNSGVEASRGDTICLLDSDDSFHPHKVERVVQCIKPGSILHHKLLVNPGSDCIPRRVLSGPNFYRYAQRYRFLPYIGSPTSGIAIQRDLALRLIPLPTQHVRSSADDFVVRGAALIGEVIIMPDVLGCYRVHGDNAWYGKRAPKSPEFMAALEEYLNRKLLDAGKQPVINFHDSLYARDFVGQNPMELTRLAMSVFRHNPDFTTLKFLLTTLTRAGRRALFPASPKAPQRASSEN